jgi:enediyne biosynthesis protein E4
VRPDRRGLVAIAGILVVSIGGIAAFWLVAGRGETPTVVGPPPRFVDETASSRLIHTYDGNFDFAVGGGVAAFDCNDDGRPDLYLAGGERPAELFRNDSPVGGSLRFTPLPDPVTDLASVNGAYPIDIDGDGHVDLAVLRKGGNALLRGLGDCRFEDATAAWALDPGTRHTEAFSATWEPGSTWPTLAFGNYVDPAIFGDPTTLDPAAWCEPNELVRPAPVRGSFGPPLPLTPSWCTLSMLFSDWSGSGRMDLRVSNDAHYYRATDGEEQLWRVVPGEAPRLFGADDGWVRVQVEGMGIGSYDVTGDGLPDIYLTSQADNKLQTLAAGPGQPSYRDIGLKRGVNVSEPFAGADQDMPSTAWHPEFEDVNNDGFIDLFVSKGNVSAEADYAMEDPSNLLLGQPDGTFLEEADKAGIVTFNRGRGAALVDFNLDGRLDLVEAFYGAPVEVWRNAGDVASGAPTVTVNHWLALRLEQPGPNVDAIGAQIEVRVGDLVYRRELTIGGGHAGGQLGWIHFGLGPSSGAEVRVRWPDGQVGPWQPAHADTFQIVDHGTGRIEEWRESASD